MCLGLSAVRNETHVLSGLRRLLGKVGSDCIRRLVRERGIAMPPCHRIYHPHPNADTRCRVRAHHWMTTLCKQEILLKFPSVPDVNGRER